MAYSTLLANSKNSGGVSRLLCLAAVLALISFLLIPPAAAQFDTGTISGSVTDSSGAVVPHAAVTVTNVGTGFKKSLQTDGGGNYTASALPSGDYIVSANASSFADAKSQQFVLNVGATVHVNLTMNVAAAEQLIEVTGTTTTVDTASSTAGTTLNSTQIANLPINGRDVSSFLEIAPGSVGSAGFFQGSVNGLENIFTGLNVKLDGQNASRGDINGFLDTEGQELSRVTRASVDSIQEIDYSNSGYNSDNGFSLGPQMNVITKAGTNNFHGEVFEFFRNDALDAKDYFENTPAVPKQPLRLNQFGANLAGPIVPNKLFFFANYEGDRTHLTNISPLYEIPSALVRSKMNAAMQPVLAQMAPLPAGCSSIPAPASCAVPGFDETDPVTGLPTGGGAQLVYDPAVLPDLLREDTGSVRVDYNISDRDRLFGRYNINDSLTTDTLGLNQGQVSPQYLRTQLGKIDETHTFSATLLNEFSVALNRFYSDTNSNTPTPLVGFAGFFTNLGALPGPNTFNQITPFSVFEVFDTVTKSTGAHQLKFGAQIRVNRLNEWLRPQQTYYFGSFSDLENDNPFVLAKIGFPGFVGIRNSNWDFYAQDDWRITRKLTLNLGLRYDFNTVWREGQNRIQNFDVSTQSFLPADQPPYSAPKKDWAPRVGFAYDPFGRGKTVIHGYGGLFYMPMQFGFGLTSNIPALASYNVNVFQAIFATPPFSIAYPSPNPPLIPGTQNVSAFPQHPRDPYSTNWLFGIQQEVAPSTVLTVNYTGNKVQHMQAGISFAAINVNPSNPNINLPNRPYSGFANENVDADKLYSNYHALQVQLRRRAGHLNLETNYTWSHEIDDLVNVFSGWSDPFNPNLDRGSGDWDVRHNFTASAVYSLSDLKGSSPLLRGIFGGWQASTILQTRSGLPENIQVVSGFFGNPMRPDFVPGQPLWSSGHSWPNTSYNLAAFQLPANFEGVWGHDIGNVGRNLLRAPAFFQWDLSGMKNIAVTERLNVQFRADLFNILNHPNFTNPDGGICSSITYTATSGTCVPNSNFGRSSQTIADVAGGAIGNGTARQVQFSLKLMF
jgi:hypothetical protein